jgi:hypothetical protein
MATNEAPARRDGLSPEKLELLRRRPGGDLSERLEMP